MTDAETLKELVEHLLGRSKECAKGNLPHGAAPLTDEQKAKARDAWDATVRTGDADYGRLIDYLQERVHAVYAAGMRDKPPPAADAEVAGLQEKLRSVLRHRNEGWAMSEIDAYIVADAIECFGRLTATLAERTEQDDARAEAAREFRQCRDDLLAARTTLASRDREVAELRVYERRYKFIAAFCTVTLGADLPVEDDAHLDSLMAKMGVAALRAKDE